MADSDEHSHGIVGQQSYGKAFAIGIGLNLAFVAIEIIYGLIANSSALLADAGHNTSDILSLLFSWTAAWMATKKPRGKYTYGLRKTTILVSILNALLLFVAMSLIAMNAIAKFKNPEPVAGTQVMIVAGIGVVINTATALLFIRGRRGDLNIRGAFLHMAADASVSLGVVVAGLLINLTGVQWIDPVTSFVIIAVILWGTFRLFIDSVDLALDAVPRQIDIEEVRSFLNSVDGVEDIHDLHVWAMSTTRIALSVHIVTSRQTDISFLESIRSQLKEQFSIDHSTIQVEFGNDINDCGSNCD